MAPHSSTLAWKIPWREEPGRLQSVGSLELDRTEGLHFHFSLSCTGEGNGNPLQCSCLENPRDGEAWWAAVYGVAQSRTQLKRLSSSSKAWEGSLSDSSDELFQRGKRWAWIYRNFCWKAKSNLVEYWKITANHKRNLKLIIVLFCICEKARIWTHRNYSLDLHPNYLGSGPHLSSSRIPFIEHHWRSLQWLMAWWWAVFVVYWNSRQHFFGKHWDSILRSWDANT